MKQNSFMAWLAIIGPCLFALFLFFMLTSVSIMIDPLKQAFGVGAVGIGILSSSFFYSYSTLQIPAGLLIDKYGLRKIFLFAVVGVGLSVLGFALSPNFYVALLFRIMMGVFFSTAFAGAFYAGAIWFSAGMFPLIAGIVEMCAMFGASLSVTLLTKPVELYGWQHATLWCVFIALFIFVYSLIFVKKEDKKSINNEEKLGVLKSLSIVIVNKNIWYLGLFAGIAFSPILSIASLWGVPFFVAKHSIDLSTASHLIAMVFVGVAIGNPLIGTFAKKINSYKLCMFLGLLINIILIGVLLFDPHFNIVVDMILCFLIGLSSSTYVISFVLAKELLPIQVCSTAMAFINVLCGFLGTIIFQPLLGSIVAISRNYGLSEGDCFSYALGVVPLTLVLGLILVFLIKLPSTNHQQL